jgi:heat shock protein HspQ
MVQNQQELIKRIRKSAQDLMDVIKPIPESMITRQPDENEWSIFETAIHVRNVAMFAYGLRLRRLVYEVDPLFANYDEDSDRLADMKKSQPVEEVVEMIAAEHRAISQILSLLSEEAWERSGRHPESGSLSIGYLANRLADHAEDHIQQIRDTYSILSS